MSKERLFTIEMEREVGGRWIAEIPELPGVMAYGNTKDGARSKVEALALRVLAEEIEENKKASPISFSKIAFSNL